MQGPRRDFGSTGVKLVSDALENNTKANYQDNNLATYFQKKQGKGMAPWLPLTPPPSLFVSGPVLPTEKMIISITIKQCQHTSGNHKQYELFVLFCYDTQ